VEDSIQIDCPCTKLKIWEVLKHFEKNKSPSPDGWTVEFFTHFFDLLGDDLLELVEDSRIIGKVQSSLNSMFLALIPKENKLVMFGDYKPITLCNLCYKLIANRVNPILSRALSSEQLGFLKGRHILDAIGTTQECLHNIKVNKLKALSLKLDSKKTYECVNWDFLRLILVQTCFSIYSTNWITSCVVNFSFVVLINGETSPFFRANVV
jgi:hypothetical protein